ncbi:bifunctional hydroxymethylpyrimidine kinase/phosphomethylpyrimidine kinase [Diaphorobacter sp.]|uniref:bifunctional hydroxymethylpyrimidine kinase/phosphomethylpyrimidine kinase n=1 Tax=Diaphorobacter sp. TaxID=1934310 RepID=UPI0028B0385D|nr:bifunctional hydroxymethylpyrimidine kinase/phosphomethylpyrimidine kinase [Diaphorobacter sp.]
MKPEQTHPTSLSSPGQPEEIPGAVCVLTFNANDPSGAGGLTGDTTAMASVGAHALAIVTGTYVRDTTETVDFYPIDDEAVADQAQTIFQDVPIQAIKVGFAGSPENLAIIAQVTADYPEIPVIAYMPNLSWWEDDRIDQYLDAFQELVLPQTSVLVGNHSTLRRWLLQDWEHERAPTAREIAMAAAEHGVAYSLVTGVPVDNQHFDNVLTSGQAILGSGQFERLEVSFSGAGDTLSAALAALIACDNDLGDATREALLYLDGCLLAAYRPGMGKLLPDRMFWAQPDDEDDDAQGDEPSSDGGDAPDIDAFQLPPHDTSH